MPSKDYTPELLDLKGAIIKNIYHTTTKIHIYFSMEKRPHTCPKCGSVTENVHDYRDSVIRDIPISYIIENVVIVVIVVLAVINVFMRIFLYPEGIFAPLLDLLFIPLLCFVKLLVLAPLQDY